MLKSDSTYFLIAAMLSLSYPFISSLIIELVFSFYILKLLIRLVSISEFFLIVLAILSNVFTKNLVFYIVLCIMMITIKDYIKNRISNLGHQKGCGYHPIAYSLQFSILGWVSRGKFMYYIFEIMNIFI